MKNNMNTIASLLSLQAGTLTEQSAITALEDAQHRIQSMTLLYDQLYRKKDFSRLPVNEYFGVLIDEIISNFPDSISVKTIKQIDCFVLEISKLQPLGIILNELLTNCMKYAFAGKNEGVISVSIFLNGDQVTIEVADNGIGIPESVSFENSSGFGLVLVNALVQQLHGKIRIEKKTGTRIILEFAK
jgi:two-component sensor histidine kinase